MNLLTSLLIINEVFPNPSSGSEWVEILYLGENQPVANEYLNFTISDDKRVIYRFQGDEVWSDNLLLVELSGLNNDKDSVILKNVTEIIIDEMSYTSTQKDLSWSRIDPYQSMFILGEASPLAQNPVPIPSIHPTTSLKPTANPKPTAHLSLAPTNNPSLTPTSNPSLTPTNKPSPTATPNTNSQALSSTANKINNNKLLSPQDLSQKYFANYQNYQKLQISYPKNKQFANSRQVFLGQKILKKTIIDAIMGSSLLVIAAILFSYEQRKKS